MASIKSIYQFRIKLRDIEPPIWRRIQVPSNYSFWDLHVAIQDAMGWLDCHLHAFRIRLRHKRKRLIIGIPDNDYPDDETLPGWDIPIKEYFSEPGDEALYEYDFGDSWLHTILLEGILIKEKGTRYPKCIAGERACPPEDCGSIPGYYHLLDVVKNPNHPDYQDMITWLGGDVTLTHPYDPELFDPKQVHFDNPGKRWDEVFKGW